MQNLAGTEARERSAALFELFKLSMRKTDSSANAQLYATLAYELPINLISMISIRESKGASCVIKSKTSVYLRRADWQTPCCCKCQASTTASSIARLKP